MDVMLSPLSQSELSAAKDNAILQAFGYIFERQEFPKTDTFRQSCFNPTRT